MTTILSIQASVVSVSSQHGALTRAIQLTFSSVYQLVGLRTPQLALPMLHNALLLLVDSAHWMFQLTLTIVL